MRRSTIAGLLLGLVLAAASGCVERRFVVESNPPGALVLMNGQPLGATPVDGHFLFYGTYDFTLIKDGYETMHVRQKIDSPWYEYFPIDFVSENLYPAKIEDVRRFNFDLRPLSQPRTDDLINQAETLRGKGKSLPNG